MENLNLPPFYVGQKVVAIKDSITPGVYKKGDVFTVKSIQKCCLYSIDIGIKSHFAMTYCSVCGCNYHLGREVLCFASSFKPLEKSKFRAVSFEKIMEETEKICVN